MLVNSAGTSSYVWDKDSNRFRNLRTGQYVDSLQFRRELDTIVDRSIVKIKKITENLRVADITLPEWQTQMASEIKSIHTVFGAAAHGGFNNMTANDWSRVSANIDTQLTYLRNFAEQIYTGQQSQDRSMLSRASLYAETARSTYENERRITEVDSGMTEESNLLAAGDNCNGCVDATLAGWVPIGTLPPIGARECQSRCRCNIIYRKGKTDE